MKRAIAVAIALACAACGSSSDAPVEPAAPRASATPKSGAENEAPTIESVTLSPDPASAGEPITLELKARDPERDRLTTNIEWYKNGVAVPELHGSVIDAGTFKRGDRVYAVATVADATHEVTAQTAVLSIGNSAPRVRSVLISPAKVTALDVVEVQANAEDPDGDSVELSYQWYRNGEPIAGATGPRLPADSVHRGDKLAVSVSATDGSDAGPATQSPPIVVANAAPVITTQPSYDMTPTGSYTYTVGAKDADNDAPLKFELLEGPKGMTIDEQSGVVTWAVPDDAKGGAIKVAVTDPYGGRVTQAWVLAVEWGEKPVPSAKGKSKGPVSQKRKPTVTGGESPASEDTSAGEEAAPAERAPSAKAAARNTGKASQGDEEEPDEDQGAAYDEEKF
jgi:hypothetical protein